MENASKALIIAGAILISILLIGIGMLIYNGAIGGINEAVTQMSQQEKDIFNAPFIKYEGAKVTGSNVRALVQEIISNNNANQDIEEKQVKVNGKLLGSTELSNYKINTINTGKSYSVVMNYNSATGLVDNIDIK